MSFLGAKKKEQFTPLPDEIIKFLPSAHFGRKNLIAVEVSLKVIPILVIIRPLIYLKVN